MQVTRQYKAGGFFGNSQAKFSDMEGAGGGINMGYANRGLLKTKGAALRREKRHLKQLERQGKLNEYGTQSADRLDYLRNVQKDRAKKGIAAGALAAGAAFGAPALVGAVKGAGGLAGIAGKAGGALGKLKGSGTLKKAMKVQKALGDSGFFRGAEQNPDSGQYGNRSTAIEDMQLGAMEGFDAAPDDNFDYEAEATGPQLQDILGGISNLPWLKYGGKMRVAKSGMRFSPDQQRMLMAMLGARLPR